MFPEAKKDVVRQRVLDLALYSKSYYINRIFQNVTIIGLLTFLGGQV